MKQAPKYLVQKEVLIDSVVFIVLFSALFIFIYRPFADNLWFNVKPAETLLLTISFFTVAIGILALSKVLLYMYQSKYELHMSTYILWIAAEFVLIGSVYILFTQTFGFGHEKITFNLILRTSINVGLILAIPYAIITIKAHYRSKLEELNLLLVQKQMLIEPRENHLINFYDCNDNLKISLYEDSVSYIESADNYVQIYYEMDGKLQSYLLRTGTQRTWELLSDTALIRCHRSFIVNPKKVKLFKDFKDHASIVLANPGVREIPVSKSYYKDVCLAIDQAGCPRS